MSKIRIALLLLGILIQLSPFICLSQVGINTTNPKGALDVTSINNTGLVLPRVSAIEDVTDGNTNPPANGTTVFDLSRNTTCFYINNDWVCIDVAPNGDPVLTDGSPVYDIDYIKASNTNDTDVFGSSLAISEDGNTLAVGTPYERSSATGINGTQADNSLLLAGAVYIFTRVGQTWSQQAYIKASTVETYDRFGYSLTLSHDGNSLAVSAIGDSSNATGVNGDQTNNAAQNSGAVYVFNRTGTTWAQEAYLKASNTEDNDWFGDSIAISGDGTTLAISATYEDSNATGINGNQNDNTFSSSGAVYVFIKTGVIWSQEAYIKASNTDVEDYFGRYLDVSYDGNTLAVSAEGEDSNATGINGDQTNNNLGASGAVYIYVRGGNTWSQQAYIKSSHPGIGDVFGGVSQTLFIAYSRFGNSISIANDGNTLAIGSGAEDSNAIGINGNMANNSRPNSGAAYLFTRTGTTWSQETYFKASNPDINDAFGASVSLSGDGNVLAVSAPSEESNATGINGDQTDNSIFYGGAVYLFTRSGNTWVQKTYVKATNTGIDPWTGDGDSFSYGTVLSKNGKTLVVAAPFEDSDATGINGNQTDNSSQDAGAVYVYTTN